MIKGENVTPKRVKIIGNLNNADEYYNRYIGNIVDVLFYDEETKEYTLQISSPYEDVRDTVWQENEVMVVEWNVF